MKIIDMTGKPPSCTATVVVGWAWWRRERVALSYKWLWSVRWLWSDTGKPIEGGEAEALSDRMRLLVVQELRAIDGATGT